MLYIKDGGHSPEVHRKIHVSQWYTWQALVLPEVLLPVKYTVKTGKKPIYFLPVFFPVKNG